MSLPSEVRISRARRIAFFGLTSLVLGWFEAEDGPAIPVTDLGYGAFVGIPCPDAAALIYDSD